LAGAVASRGETSVLTESVSMSRARSAGKTFWVATSLVGGGVSTAADTAVRTVFFDVGAVSLVLCRLRLRTPTCWGVRLQHGL
jgi:hypothetical protein